jgi:hypothetical protein
VLTKEGKVFFNGNFWKGKVLSEDQTTGVKEMDVEKAFEGH